MKSYLAIDIGGTNMRAASYPEDGQDALKYNRISTRSEGMNIEDRLIHLIETIWPEDADPCAVGIACPGPLDSDNGIVIQPPNIPEWEYFPLEEFLEDKLSLPVVIEKDANLAAFGEWQFGAGQGYHHLIYLTISTGVGGGIIINDQLLLGSHGFAGEIGHITVSPEGPECSCGRKGHLEAYSSGPSIVRWVSSQLEDEKLQDIFPEVELTAKILQEAAEQGNQLARAAFERAGRHIGFVLADLLHIFNPEIIVIGGGVSKAGDVLFAAIRETVASSVLSQAFLDEFQIVPAALGDNSGLLGALAFARKAFA